MVKRYLLLVVLIAFFPVMAQADVSVKDTTSYEFIRNQGYSDEVHRVIEIKTKDPATPIVQAETSKKEKMRWYLRELDPAYTRESKFLEHNIKFNPSLEDL